MKGLVKYLLMLLLMLASPIVLYGQTPEVEKLQQELKTASGTNEVDKLIKLGLLKVGFDANEALQLFLTAERKAVQINYKKGIALSKRMIGQCYHMQNNFKKAKVYYSESLKLFKSIKDDSNTASLMYYLVNLQFTQQNNYAENKKQVKEVIDFCMKKNEVDILILAYLLLGDIEYGAYHNKEALATYFEAANLASKDEKNIARLSNVYGKIASVYNDLSSYESAYKYQLKSVEISRKLNSPELPVNLINLGQVLDGSGKEKQATEFYREALKISHKYKNQHFIAVSSENLARNLTIRKKYKEATPYVEQSLTIYREMKNVPKIAAALGLSGKIYFNLGQYEKARIFVDEALSNKQNQKEKPELYLLHSLILEKQHKDSNALTSYKQYVSVKDSIQKIEDKQNTEALLVKYDTRLKDTQNELLTKDLKINQLKLSSQRSVILFLVIGLVLLILLLTALYKLFSSKKKTNRILATQKKELSIANIQLNEAINTKDKFFSILSHDLRDPVISMQSFGRMMSTKYDVMTEDERRELIEDNVKSSDGLFNLLEELLLWARCQTGVIYPVYEKIELGAFLSEVCRFYEQIAEQKGVLLKCSYQGTGKVRVDRSMLATILRNLISNAIKFSYLHQTVEVLCELKEKWIILSVKDEGEGMTKEELNRLFSITSNFTKSGTANEKGNGLGLIICYEFVHALHGEILVKSEKGKGATFTVKIPSGAIVEDLN